MNELESETTSSFDTEIWVETDRLEHYQKLEEEL